MTRALGLIGLSLLLAFALGSAALRAGEPLAPGDLTPAALQVDRLPNLPSSNGNSILEPGEIVVVEPAWRNSTAAPVTATGNASAFMGAGAPGLYTIPDGVASYGTIAAGQVASCTATGDCYRMALGVPAVRPEPHWDATFGEATSTGSLKTWSLHVGDTFTDVPLSSPFYRFVETLVHHNVTGGCAAGVYCPSSPITREQLTAFALAAKEGRFFVPVACALGGETFADVPATSPFCRWVEELARRGVVSGCGSGQYCPTVPVSREQMAVFMLSTREGPAYDPPACVPGSEAFDDVPAASPFCRWIEELFRRGVVTGCGGDNYCPGAPVTREQMAVFISGTFGISASGVAPHMYVVNSADDVNDGACSPSHCSLREAVTVANATPNPSVREEIRFAIPGVGPHVIRPNAALPPITQVVVVDGYSQPGAVANTLARGSNAVLKIELDLSASGFSGGFRLSTNDALVRGLAMNRSPWIGLAVGGHRNAIEGCYIGTDASGTVDLGNAGAGIGIEESFAINRIGGTLPAQRNVLSGNGGGGLEIDKGSLNVVQGNLIGTDRTGTVAIPNVFGVRVLGPGSPAIVANANVIGGLEYGAGNVISGNTGAGVGLGGSINMPSVTNTRIQANIIGRDATGTSALPNLSGVRLDGEGVYDTLIGGLSAVPAGNSITALEDGVQLNGFSGGPRNTRIQGNLIRGSQYGVRGTATGGDITANVIGPNAASGVFLISFSAPFGRIAIRGNNISGHGGLGIDLAPVGPTPNDPGDSDVGQNGLQNFPVITSAVRSGNTLTVTGTLNSRPSATYTVELFVSASAHPSGYGEGAASLGTFTVSTDAAGNAPIAVVQPSTVTAGSLITATATDAGGNTSEFSAARTIQ